MIAKLSPRASADTFANCLPFGVCLAKPEECKHSQDYDYQAYNIDDLVHHSLQFPTYTVMHSPRTALF